MKNDNSGKCPFCGAPLQENASFCLHCMKELGDKKEIKKEKSREKLLPVLLCVSVILFLSLLCLLIFRNTAASKKINSEKPEDSKEVTEVTSEVSETETEKVESTSDETTAKAAKESVKSGDGTKETTSAAKTAETTKANKTAKATPKNDETSGSAAQKTSPEPAKETTAATRPTVNPSPSQQTAPAETTGVPASQKPSTNTKSKSSAPSKTPTVTQHTHSYSQSVAKSPTCAVAGESRFICSCGDSYTKAIPATGLHNWIPITKKVHHDETGHYEEQQTGSNKITKYKCFYCYSNTWYDSLDALKSHFASHSSDPNYNYYLNHLETMCSKKDFYEPIIENVWVVDSKAYDETVTTGYKCSTCGAVKQ